MAVSDKDRKAYEEGRATRVEPDFLDVVTCGTTWILKEIMAGGTPSGVIAESGV